MEEIHFYITIVAHEDIFGFVHAEGYFMTLEIGTKIDKRLCYIQDLTLFKPTILAFSVFNNISQLDSIISSIIVYPDSSHAHIILFVNFNKLN